MHLVTKPNSRVLLTTPDYPPKLGGLSTFTLNIEKVLSDLGIVFDVLVWKEIGDLKRGEGTYRAYDYALHIHFMAGFFLPYKIRHHVNFIHGSEILFYSPNPLKRMIKNFLRAKMMNYFSESYMNVFISNFTQKSLVRLGHQVNYSKDIVLHNCIKTDDCTFQHRSLESEHIKLICVARNVPHKNITSALRLCCNAVKALNKEITLYVTAPLESVGGVNVVNIAGVDNSELESLYQQCHFNILLSLDHSDQGFFEGFGLTVLEAGKYGVPSIVSKYGGLPEAVHHNKTGWVLEHVEGRDADNCFLDFWRNLNEEDFERTCRYVYEHTHNCHGLNQYHLTLGKLLA